MDQVRENRGSTSRPFVASGSWQVIEAERLFPITFRATSGLVEPTKINEHSESIPGRTHLEHIGVEKVGVLQQ